VRKRWRLIALCVLATLCAYGTWASRPPREALLPPPPGAAPGEGVGLAVPVAVAPGDLLEVRNAGGAPVRVLVEWPGGRYLSRSEVPPGWRLVLNLRLPAGVVHVSPVLEADRGGMAVGLRYVVRIGGG
jgi:hypothetical protein